MPLDDALTDRMSEPDFWPLYFFEEETDLDDEDGDEEENDEPEYRAEFTLPDGSGLVLDIDLELGYFQLGLAVPGEDEPPQLGWDDQAHFHPHVMRWAELDLLARAFALNDPSLRHPGPVVGLLARFVVLDESDDLDRVSPLVDAAFDLLRPAGTARAVKGSAKTGRAARRRAGVRPETLSWYELRDLSGTGLRWTAEESGCPAVEQPDGEPHQRPLYSLRSPGSEEFPFAGWAALLARAEWELAAAASDPALRDAAVRTALERCTARDGHARLGQLAEALRAAGFAQPVLLRAIAEPASRAESCWAVELLAGLAQGELVKRWFGRSPLTGSERWELLLTLPEVVGRSAEHCRTVTAELDAALRSSERGWAEHTGSLLGRMSEEGYLPGADNLDVLVRGDLAAGVTVVAEVLRRHDAAGSAELRHTAPPYERIDLG